MGRGQSSGPVQPAKNPSIQFALPNVEGLVMKTQTQKSPVGDKTFETAQLNPIELAKSQLNVQEDIQKKEYEREANRKDLRKAMDTFLMYDEMIPRGSGLLDKTLQGLDSTISGWSGTGNRGAAVKMHNDLSEAIKTPLAKFLGNVGNLTQQEQQSAKQILPHLFDSEEVVQLKREYLRNLIISADSGNKDMTKHILDSFRESSAFNKDKHAEENRTDMNDIFGPEEDVSKVKF